MNFQESLVISIVVFLEVGLNFLFHSHATFQGKQSTLDDTECNLQLQFFLLHSMDCQTNNLDNSLPFHQSLGLIQLIFVNYFLLEACSHKVCFKVGNWKPVEHKRFATTATTVREVVWGFTWLQPDVPKALGWTPRFWQWNTLAADFSRGGSHWSVKRVTKSAQSKWIK